jgi:hypothetical protein
MRSFLAPALILALSLPGPVRADDRILFALEQAARDIQGGLDSDQVVNRMLRRMEPTNVSVPRSTVVLGGPWVDGSRLLPDDVPRLGNRLAMDGMYWHAVDGRNPRITLGWANIHPFDANNPCHQGLMHRARNGAIEEVIHAFDDAVGPRKALEYTPAYKDFLKRTGMSFYSEAYAYAFMEEHMGIKPSLDEIDRYWERRTPYFLHRDPDLVPGKGLGEIPSRPAPGPDFFKPKDTGIDLLGDDPCLKRLKRLQKVADAAPPGSSKAGRFARFFRWFKGGGGKVARGGGRVLGVAGGVAGGVGVVNLVDASGKGAVLGYAEVKANQQRNQLLWDLYHDPMYAGDPRFDQTRTGSITTQGVNPKLRTVIVRLSDSLWGNIEFGPSLVDIIP